MKKLNHISVLFFTIIFTKINCMEKQDFNKVSLKRKASNYLLNRSRNKLPKISMFNQIPNELKEMIFMAAVEGVIKDNANKPTIVLLNDMTRLMKALFLVDKDFREFKDHIENFAKKKVAEFFNSCYRGFSQEEKDAGLKDIVNTGRYNKSKEAEAIKLLIAGASPDITVNYNKEVMPLINKIIISNYYLNLLPIMFKRNVKLNNYSIIPTNNNALHSAVMNDRLDIVKQILSYNGFKFENNIDALNVAISLFKNNIVKEFLNNDKVNIRDNCPNILAYAIYWHNIEVVEMLLNQRKFDLHFNYKFGFSTPLELAWRLSHETQGFYKVMKRLCENKDLLVNDNDLDCLNHTFFFAVANNNVPLVKRCLQTNKINMSIRDENGNTAIVIARDLNYNKMFKILLAYIFQENNKIDCGITNLTAYIYNNNNKALIDAVQSKNYNLVKEILNRGKVNVNFKDKYDRTALFYAVLLNLPHVVDLLLSHSDIDINIMDIFRKTPLMIALENNYTEISSALSNYKNL